MGEAEEIAAVLERHRGKRPDPDEDAEAPFVDEDTKRSYDRGKADQSMEMAQKILDRHSDLPPSEVKKVVEETFRKGGDQLDAEAALAKSSADGKSRFGEEDAKLLTPEGLEEAYGDGKMNAVTYNAERVRRGLEPLS